MLARCLSISLLHMVSGQQGKAIVGFTGGSYTGHEQWDWDALTHLGFWTEPSSDVRATAKSHGVKLFRDHSSGCGIDCYTDDSKKEEAVQQIVAMVQSDDLDGVFFDEERSGFELSSKQKAGYTDFVTRVGTALKALGKGIFVCVGGRPSYEFRGYDYKNLADVSDFLFIMGYDMHFWDDYSCVLNGECSPAEAPYPDIKDGVQQYLKQVSGDKLVLGLPWYGQRYTYYGPLPINEGQVDYKDVLTALEKTGKTPKMVNNDKSWKLVCGGECISGKKGDVIWYDDAETLTNKYLLAADQELLGVGVWKLDDLPYDGTHDAERDAMWKALSGWMTSESKVV